MGSGQSPTQGPSPAGDGKAYFTARHIVTYVYPPDTARLVHGTLPLPSRWDGMGCLVDAKLMRTEELAGQSIPLLTYLSYGWVLTLMRCLTPFFGPWMTIDAWTQRQAGTALRFVFCDAQLNLLLIYHSLHE